MELTVLAALADLDATHSAEASHSGRTPPVRSFATWSQLTRR
jgi:hypothetical protein